MDGNYVKFRNDQGLAEIAIGVTEFECIGASPPDDHPHTYHTTGDRGFVHCLYCNTKYVFLPRLGRAETDPAGNAFEDESPAPTPSRHSRENLRPPEESRPEAKLLEPA